MLNLGTIGAVAVAIGGDTSGLKKAMGEADQSLAKTKLSMDAVKKVSAALGLALLATGAAVGAMVKRAADYADKTIKLAQTTGVAVRTLSEMTYVAKLAGVSQDGMAGAMGRLNRNIADAAAGTGDAIRAFDALGINVKNADGTLKSADIVMAEISDKFAGMEDGATKSAIAMMTMGRSGAQLIPMLNGGARSMQELRNEAALFGNVVDEKTGRAAEQFNDNLTRMGEIASGVGMRMAQAVLPTLEKLSNQFVDTAKNTEGLARAGEVASNGLKILMTVGTFVGTVFKLIQQTVGGVAGALVALLGGRFREAANIGMQAIGDWKTTIQGAATSVLDTWEDTSKKIGTIKFDPQGGGGGGKSKGPRIASTEELNAAKNEEKKLLEESAAGWVAHAEAVMAAAEEELLALAAINEEKWRIIDGNLERLADSFKTEAELMQEKYDSDLEALRVALENQALTQEEFDSYAEQLATRHEERMNAIHEKGLTDRERFERMSMSQKAKTVFGALSNITSGVAQHNKKLFELNKVAGIADAVMNAYVGISKTLAAYPFPVNVALAAAHGLAAFAQVNAIRSASFGGGGGAAPALAGGTAAPPVSPVGGGAAGGGGRSGQHTTVILPGTDGTSTAAVREMLKGLQEEIGANGGRLEVR